MKAVFTLLVVSLLFASCTADNQSDRFVEVEDVVETVSAVEELGSVNEKEEEVIDFIEFEIEENDVVLDVGKISILNEYLRGQQNQQEAVLNMELERIPSELENIYILSFSCVNERCSYLLLHEDQNKDTFLVADMATYVNSYISPDQSKIAIQFNRFTGMDSFQLSNLIVIDTVNWEVLPITNEETSFSLLNYRWPFVSVEWLDEKSIAISIPELIELNKDSYDEWSSSEVNSVSTNVYYIKEE